MRSESGAGLSRRAAVGLKAGLGKGLHAEAHEELSASHGRALSVSAGPLQPIDLPGHSIENTQVSVRERKDLCVGP